MMPQQQAVVQKILLLRQWMRNGVLRRCLSTPASFSSFAIPESKAINGTVFYTLGGGLVLLGGTVLFMDATSLGNNAAAVTRVSCQEQYYPNPLWPAGISEKDVEAFVDSALADKSINMVGIPDEIERSIYVATISLTANLIYRGIARLHGIKLFNHKFILRRQMTSLGSAVVDGKHLGIDEQVIVQVADRLLMNNSVNLTMVPDYVERQLYVNCLKLILHLLDTIAESIRITFCGHDLRLHFEPSNKVFESQSSKTMINSEELVQLARRSVHAEGVYGELQIQLQACMYGLVLGLVDDLLANTEIEMLSDRVKIDIVDGATTSSDLPLAANVPKTSAKRSKPSNTFAPFCLGMGAGAAIAMAALSLAGRRG